MGRVGWNTTGITESSDTPRWSNAFHSGARTIEELRTLVYGRLESDLERAADASIRAHVVHMRECGDEVSTIAGLDDVSLLPEEA